MASRTKFPTVPPGYIARPRAGVGPSLQLGNRHSPRFVRTLIPASGELNTAMPPAAMLPSLSGARADVVSLIAVFVALALIVLLLRQLAETGDK